MKMFYTIQELQTLSVQEFNDLVSLKRDTEIYYYKDLKRISKVDEYYKFEFHEDLFTASDELYEYVKNAKIRYDLLSKNVEEVSTETQERNHMLNIIRHEMTEIFSDIKKELNLTIKDINKTIKDINDVNIDRLDTQMQKIDKIINAFDNLLE